MPYLTNADLPPRVRNVLPPHAQDIYRAAFDNAWRAHGERSDQEEIAHRVAWAAVKKKYEKADGRWMARG